MPEQLLEGKLSLFKKLIGLVRKGQGYREMTSCWVSVNYHLPRKKATAGIPSSRPGDYPAEEIYEFMPLLELRHPSRALLHTTPHGEAWEP
jgi:hypothetical protein